MFQDDFSDTVPHPVSKQVHEPDETPFSVIPLWVYVAVVVAISAVVYFSARGSL